MVSNIRSFVLGSVISVFAVILVTGCGRQETFQDYMEQAQELIAKGDRKAATIQFKNAVQKDPHNAEARYRLGMLYLESEEYLSAEKELRKARELGHDAGPTAVALGRTLFGIGTFQKVIDEITPPAAVQGKTLADIHALRGDAYVALGQKDLARSAFDEALAQAPEQPGGLLGLAKLAAMDNDLKRAGEYVDAAVRLAPNDKNSLLMRADLERASGRKEEAVAAYRRALQTDPGFVAARIGLASLHLAEGELGAARKELQAARKADPLNLSVKYLLAAADYREKKYAQARDGLQEVLRHVPGHTPSLFLLGAVSLATENYEQAASTLKKVVGANPGDLRARKLLAAALLRLKQPDAALAALGELSLEEARDPSLLTLAGEISLNSRDFPRASRYFQRAAALDRRDAGARIGLGLSKLEMGDTQSGLAELEAAASEAAPADYRADTLRIQAHLQGKQWDQALEITDALDKKLPKHPLPENFRGLAYVGKGDLREARRHFELALGLDPTYFPAALSLAQLDMRDKQPEAAKERFLTILARDKNHLQSMLALAGLAAQTGDEKGLAGWLERAVKADPTALKPKMLLAEHYLTKKQPQKALVLAREARDIAPNNAEAVHFLGAAQLAAEDYENALSTFRKLTQLAPHSPVAHFRVATVYLAMKNEPAARQALNKALELQPDFADAQATSILLDIKAKRYADAMKHAKAMQSQHPNAPIGFSFEGDILMAQKQPRQASEAYEKAFRLGKSSTLAIKLHQSLYASGNSKEANSKLIEWIEAHPDDLFSRNYLAETYQRSGQNRQAIEQYLHLLKKAPNNPMALNNLAVLYSAEKDKRAAATAEQAYKLQPGSPAIMDTLGWILAENGQLSRAMELLRKAAAMAPQSLEIRYHLAATLARSGDKAAARTELEKLLRSGKDFPQHEAAKELLQQLR